VVNELPGMNNVSSEAKRLSTEVPLMQGELACHQ
jgi:hypothetical protein